MKKKINFTELQRFDKVDANDLQDLIYNQIEEFTKGLFRSSAYGIVNLDQQEDNDRFRAMHGPLSIPPYVAIDQANDQLRIDKPFSVVERNSGDIITFTQEDVDLGYGVMPMASVQAFVDANESDFRQNDINSVFTALGVFAYPVEDILQEERAFFDVNTASTTNAITTTRNRTRLNLFVDIYENRINLKDENGNYPTLIGKWEFGRIEDNIRTDTGGGNYSLNPVVQWPSQAGWIANSVWNWILPDSFNVMQGIDHTDRSVANADKLPNSITEPTALRNGYVGAPYNDIRLAFDHIIRLIDRIQCAGTNDPTSTDLGTRTDANTVLDAYGDSTGTTKSVSNSIHAEHPPYSLRGLKRLLDIAENNKTHTASKGWRLKKALSLESGDYAFTDGVVREVQRSVSTSPSGDYELGLTFDFYDVFTNSLGVSTPGTGESQMDLQSARASAITGIMENTSGTPIFSNVVAYSDLFRNMILTFPVEYINWDITSISITPILNYPNNSLASWAWNGGSSPRAMGANAPSVNPVILVDDDGTLSTETNGWKTAPIFDECLKVKQITYTNNIGTKVASYGVRIALGTNSCLISNFDEKLEGFAITVSIKNNTVIS